MLGAKRIAHLKRGPSQLWPWSVSTVQVRTRSGDSFVSYLWSCINSVEGPDKWKCRQRLTENGPGSDINRPTGHLASTEKIYQPFNLRSWVVHHA